MSEKSAAQTKKTECLSMTGYAQSKGGALGWDLRVSVKSVNHRFLDLKIRLPEGFDLYELRLRQIVRERIHRGHIEVQVTVEPGVATPIQVNKDLVANYLRAADDLRLQTSVSAALDVVALLRLPGVIGGLAPSLPEGEDQQEQLGRELEKCLREALGKLDEMRRAEGRHLTEEVRALVIQLRPSFARRLESRLKDLLSGTAIDPARVAQEAAMLAERSDISEELDRLKSHIQQFTRLLDGAGELGKKLDFLLQEMHREANTMLSKTPGVESEALKI